MQGANLKEGREFLLMNCNFAASKDFGSSAADTEFHNLERELAGFHGNVHSKGRY